MRIWGQLSRLVGAGQSSGLFAGARAFLSELIVAGTLQIVLVLLKLCRHGIPKLVGEFVRERRLLAFQERAEPGLRAVELS